MSDPCPQCGSRETTGFTFFCAGCGYDLLAIEASRVSPETEEKPSDRS